MCLEVLSVHLYLLQPGGNIDSAEELSPGNDKIFICVMFGPKYYSNRKLKSRVEPKNQLPRKPVLNILQSNHFPPALSQ